MRAWLAIGAMTLLAAATSSSLRAQGYPMPASSSEPNVICNAQPACSGSLGMPLWPYSVPLKDHTGRYLDSAYTKDWQAGGRTVRADMIRINETRGRLYLGMGTRFGAYSLDSFFAMLGQPLAKAPRGEDYMRPQSDVYPETDKSWKTRIMDAQEFLGDYDFDDRGYVYLPYSVWGWGIVQDAGSLSAAIYQDFFPEANPAKLLVLKGTGGKYYVATSNGSKIQMYDATNPAATKSLRVLSQSVNDWARLRINGTDMVAIASRTGELSIYSADALASGGAPGTTLKGYYLVTASDDAFWAMRRGGGSSPATAIAEIRGGSSPASFSATDYSIEGGLYPSFIQYGAGHVTAAGGTGSGDLRVWKIAGGGLQRIEFFDYFRNHYTVPPSGYAKPDNYTQLIRHALVHEYKGKLYLIVSYDGIGDVYELQGRDSVSVSIDTTRGYGTKNTNSPTAGTGPFYGDLVPFRSSYPTAALSNVAWNFDNPEAGTAATPTLPIGLAQYQYRGLTSSNAITRSRTATGSDPGDPTNGDDVAVNLQVPVARIGLKASGAVEVLSGSTVNKVAVGAQFVDASDGAVEGHVSSWQGTSGDMSLRPNESYAVRGCGAGTLSLTPYYGPYSGTSPNLSSSDTSPFTPGTKSVSYTAEPFVADLTLSSASVAAPVVFSNASRIFPTATNLDGTDFFAAGVATQWTVKWEMLAAPDESSPTLPASKESLIAIGTLTADGNLWSVDRAYIRSGRKVRLTLTMAADAVPSCANGQVQQVVEYTLELPKPAIEVTGCGNVGAPCSISAVPATGATANGWSSYKWSVNGLTRSSAPAFDPAFTEAGSHIIHLTVANALGETTVSRTVTVEPSLCNGKPTNIAFTWNGSRGCNSATPCAISESITFAPTSFGYSFQDCDTYAWNFGDGTSSTEKNPVKSYSSNGTKRVSLTVKNTDGQETFSYDVQVGQNEEPPPPPQCELPTTIYPEFSGATSGCSPLTPNTPCRTSETIRLAVSGGLQQVPSCATVSWSLGDGRSTSGRNPSITYSQPGTYTVSATVRSSSGASRTGSVTVQVAGGSTPNCPISAPSGLPSVGYLGSSSGCSTSNATNCNRTESIQLTLYSFNYTMQSCDVVVWDFDDGSAQVETSGRTVSHTFAGAKDMYRVTARIKNSSGQSEPGVVNVVFQRLPAEEAPRNARITGPTSVRTDDAVQFSAAAEGNVTRWTWNFGDGTSSSQQNPTKTWSTPGTYTVSLSAENSGGASIASQQVTVSDGTAFRYLLPAVARLEGQNSTQWRSDWLLFNPDPAFDPSKPLEIELEFREANQTIRKTFVMDASTKVVEDIVKTVFGLDVGRGSVIVSGVGEAVPQMWTRTYTESATGVGTYGQLIPAVRLDTTGESTTESQTYLLAGLRGGNRFRTNVGIINPGSTPTSVEIKGRDADGFLILQSSLSSVPVDAYGYVQVSLFQIFGTDVAATAPISLELTASDGRPIVAYGSVIDNISSDPVYIEAIPRSELADAAYRRQVLPGVGKVNSWRSDVTIYSSDTGQSHVDLYYFDSTGTQVAEAKGVPIVAGSIIQLDDLLGDGHPMGQLRPVPEGASSGTLVVEVPAGYELAGYPLVLSRTYSDQGEEGSFGQGIGAVPATGGNVSTETPAFIPGVRNDKYRTNIGIVSLEDRPTTVRVTLLDSLTGEAIGSETHNLKHFQSIIASDVFARLNKAEVSEATVKIEVIDGGEVWAYASIIDKTTTDPEYVPAISFRQ